MSHKEANSQWAGDKLPIHSKCRPVNRRNETPFIPRGRTNFFTMVRTVPNKKPTKHSA